MLNNVKNNISIFKITGRASYVFKSCALLCTLMLFPVLSHAVTATISAPSTDSDGAYQVTWSTSTAGRGGYTLLQQRFNGGAWGTLVQKGTGSQYHTINVSVNGTYDYRVYFYVVTTASNGYPIFNTGYSPVDTTVVSINSAPSISGCGTMSFPEDGSMGIPVTVSDAETAVGSLTLAASSSNQSLIPNNNIILTNNGSIRGVNHIPLPDQHGTATITLTVSDGLATASCQSIVTVTSVNDPPSISDISSQTIGQDTDTGSIPFSVSDGDPETAAGSLTVTASSSNTGVVPNGNIVLGGSGGSRTINVIPAAGQTGSSTITVTVSDGSLDDKDTFVVSVDDIVRFKYDALGRLIRVEHSDAITDQYDYDAAGNRTSVSSTSN